MPTQQGVPVEDAHWSPAMTAPLLCRILWHVRPEGADSRHTLYWQCSRCQALVPGNFVRRKQAAATRPAPVAFKPRLGSAPLSSR